MDIALFQFMIKILYTVKQTKSVKSSNVYQNIENISTNIHENGRMTVLKKIQMILPLLSKLVYKNTVFSSFFKLCVKICKSFLQVFCNLEQKLLFYLQSRINVIIMRTTTTTVFSSVVALIFHMCITCSFELFIC